MSAVRVNLPPSLRYATSNTGQIPVHFEGAPNTPWQGDSKWRGVKGFGPEYHTHLCRVFGLPEGVVRFDVPSSARGIGANQTGYGGGASAKLIQGFVLHPQFDRPIAKLTICAEGQRFKDVDPASESDFYDLSHR